MEKLYKEIQTEIKEKKENFRVSINSYKMLSKNLLIPIDTYYEYRAYELLSDMRYLEIVEKIFHRDVLYFENIMSKDFKFLHKKLEFPKVVIPTYSEYKDTINKIFLKLEEKINENFGKITKDISKQSVDSTMLQDEINDVKNQIKLKLDKNKKELEDLEVKYVDILTKVLKKIKT